MNEEAYKTRLFAPGPVSVPAAVLEAVSKAPLHHRTPAFARTLKAGAAALARALDADGDDVVVLTGSGTVGFEAAFLTFVPAATTVVAVHAGKFGERWGELAEHYGHAVHHVTAPWGEVVPPEAIAAALESVHGVGAVLLVHSETSTGVLHDVAAQAAAIRRVAPEATIVVDAVTSLGVSELRPRAWELDVVVSGSQKGVGLPPGLAFVWASPRAWDRAVSGRAFSFDLVEERRMQRRGETGTTPATSLIAGLEVAVELLLAPSLEATWQRRRRFNDAVLAAGAAMGLTAYARVPSPAVAALRVDGPFTAPALVNAALARGLRMAGGQGATQGYVVRPSVLGDVDAFDVMGLVAVLETCVRSLGGDVAYGAASAAAARVLESTNGAGNGS